MKILESNRIFIREFTLADTKQIYLLSREKSLQKWLPDQVYACEEEAKDVLNFLISNYKSHSLPFVMAVAEKVSNKVIGHVGLSSITQGLEIGYAIGEKYQGLGYGTEAVKLWSHFVKEKFNIDKLYGVVNYRNTASCRVLEKVGYIFQFLDTDGNFDKKALRKIYIK